MATEDGHCKIAIISGAERCASFEKLLHVHHIFASNEGGRPTMIVQGPAPLDWHRVLTELDQTGHDIVIIDDTAIPEKQAMVAGLGYFLSAPRAKEGRLRPIFVGSAERKPKDNIYIQLASSGLYDMVIPGRDGATVDKLCDLVRFPAKRGDVADLIQVTARERSVIAVAGIMPRSGATNCSIVLARTLVMLGQKPALLVDKRAGVGFQKGYKYALAPDGRSFRVNGVDVFPEELPGATPRRYTHVVYDAGYLSWGLQQASPEEQQKFIEFSKADLQVVYLPCSSPADFEYLNRFFESRTKAELERYAIGVWGATPELFDMLQAKFREKAPDVFMWNVDVYRWPLSLAKVDADIVEVLRPVLPRGVADAALTELREAAAGEGAHA